MKVYQNQLKELLKMRISSFKFELTEYLHETFSDNVRNFSLIQFDTFIDEGIRKANNYGLTSIFQIKTLFCIILTFGNRFESVELDWLHDILCDDQLTGDEKIEDILEELKKTNQ